MDGHLEDLRDAEAKVVRLVDIAASVTGSLAGDDASDDASDGAAVDPEQLKRDVAEFLRLVKVRVRLQVTPLSQMEDSPAFGFQDFPRQRLFHPL